MNTILKIGKKYILRNKLVTSKLRLSNNGTNYIYEADVNDPQFKTPSVLSFLKSGRCLSNNVKTDQDIIGEN